MSTSELAAELKEDEGAQIFRVTQRAAAALRVSGVKCEGVNFFLADGEAAMREVFHVHLHVIPRFGMHPPPLNTASHGSRVVSRVM